MQKPTRLMSSLRLFIFSVCLHHFLQGEGQVGFIASAGASTLDEIEELPDFNKISDIREKKETFFSALYPIIESENQRILNDRFKVLTLAQSPLKKLTTEQVQWLLNLAKEYHLSYPITVTRTLFKRLIQRIDYVPPSLVLTQAAIESGWGTSRFYTQGNNLFGQWCIVQGCGMVPASRDSEKDHEVAKFNTIRASVRSYLRNINTNVSYREFRQTRTDLRQNNQSLNGHEMAELLAPYSEEGPEYVVKIRKLLRQNNLQRFTKQFEQSININKLKPSITIDDPIEPEDP